MADDEIRRRLRKLQAKAEGALDQRLAMARSEYEGLDKGERRKLKAWVKRLTTQEEPQDVSLYARVLIQLYVQKGDDGETVPVSPKAMLRAIEAWDKGEDYVPRMMRDG